MINTSSRYIFYLNSFKVKGASQLCKYTLVGQAQGLLLGMGRALPAHPTIK